MTKIFCTQTACHLLDETAPSKKLKDLAHTVLGVPKHKIKKFTEVEPGTPEFSIYGMNDAIWTYDLYKKFNPEIYKQNLQHLMFDIEMPFQKVLMELEINGIGADVSAAKAMFYEVRHLYYKIEKELLDMWDGEYVVSITPRSRIVSCVPTINFNSSDQIIPLIESLGFEIFEKSKKGHKSFAKAAKKRLAGQHPFLDLLDKFGKVEKLLHGFLKPFGGFIDEDGRIRCSFHNTVAVTGRLSCGSPNIEQLPKNNSIANIRNLFISSNSTLFIVADYSGQELRIFGEEIQDPTLKKELIAGLDIHQNNADTFGLSRDDAKCVSFGVIFGKQAYGFSKDFNCSIEKAQEFLDKFFNKYPRAKLRIEEIRREAYNKGYVVNMNGRRRRFPDIKKLGKWQKERCYRQAVNFVLGQSPGADVMKVAATEIIKDTNLKIVNIVHDEVVVESLKDYVEQGKKWVEQCMLNALPMGIPWKVKIGTGERYGEAK